jgi:hypothetical protein
MPWARSPVNPLIYASGDYLIIRSALFARIDVFSSRPDYRRPQAVLGSKVYAISTTKYMKLGDKPYAI